MTDNPKKAVEKWLELKLKYRDSFDERLRVDFGRYDDYNSRAVEIIEKATTPTKCYEQLKKLAYDFSDKINIVLKTEDDAKRLASILEDFKDGILERRVYDNPEGTATVEIIAKPTYRGQILYFKEYFEVKHKKQDLNDRDIKLKKSEGEYRARVVELDRKEENLAGGNRNLEGEREKLAHERRLLENEREIMKVDRAVWKAERENLNKMEQDVNAGLQKNIHDKIVEGFRKEHEQIAAGLDEDFEEIKKKHGEQILILKNEQQKREAELRAEFERDMINLGSGAYENHVEKLKQKVGNLLEEFYGLTDADQKRLLEKAEINKIVDKQTRVEKLGKYLYANGIPKLMRAKGVASRHAGKILSLPGLGMMAYSIRNSTAFVDYLTPGVMASIIENEGSQPEIDPLFGSDHSTLNYLLGISNNTLVNEIVGYTSLALIALGSAVGIYKLHKSRGKPEGGSEKETEEVYDVSEFVEKSGEEPETVPIITKPKERTKRKIKVVLKTKPKEEPKSDAASSGAIFENPTDLKF